MVKDVKWKTRRVEYREMAESVSWRVSLTFSNSTKRSHKTKVKDSHFDAVLPKPLRTLAWAVWWANEAGARI